MGKWCNMYNCWCDDIEEILDDECPIYDNCGDCNYKEDIKSRELDMCRFDIVNFKNVP